VIEHWIILGASSSIARAFAREVSRRGAALTLVGREAADLDATAADAQLRGAASARVNRDDRVFAVVLAAEHLLYLAGLDFLVEGLETLRKLRVHGLAGLGPLAGEGRNRLGAIRHHVSIREN